MEVGVSDEYPFVDFWQLICEERGVPLGWHWYSLEAIGDSRERGGVLVKGAICTTLYKSGVRKGQKNWTKRDRSTDREFLVTFREHDDFIARWERTTGMCSLCYGTGKRVGRVGVDGRDYRDCYKCNATGRFSTPPRDVDGEVG